MTKAKDPRKVAAAKKLWADPEQHKRQSEALKKAHKADPNWVKRATKATKKKWADPVWRKMMLETLAANRAKASKEARARKIAAARKLLAEEDSK